MTFVFVSERASNCVWEECLWERMLASDPEEGSAGLHNMLQKGESVSSMSTPGSLINPKFLVEDILN